MLLSNVSVFASGTTWTYGIYWTPWKTWQKGKWSSEQQSTQHITFWYWFKSQASSCLHSTFTAMSDVLCNCCYFYRVVLEPTVPGACRDSLDPKYLVYHIHNALQYTTFHNASLKVCFWIPYKRHATWFFFALQGDRGFDGLAGLPGEKGHRVSPFVLLLKVCLYGVHVCVVILMCATVKSKCLLS